MTVLSPLFGPVFSRNTFASQLAVSRPSFEQNFLVEGLDRRFTFTRASNATFFNSAGVLTTASDNTPRFDFNPVTLAPRGLLIEGARTNSLRNSGMSGAGVDAFPTFWSGFGGGSGITIRCVGTGTEFGMNYIDVRYSGTPAGTDRRDNMEAATQIAALSGQTWTSSCFVRLVAGTTTNITNFTINVQGNSAAGAELEVSYSGSFLPTATLTRLTVSRTLTNASTAFVRQQYRLQYTTGNPIDITIRLYAPQLELGAFASSYIPTTSAAATRAADIINLPDLTSMGFNNSQGTILVEFEYMAEGSGQTIYSIEQDNTAGQAICLRRGFGAPNQLAFLVEVSAANQINWVNPVIVPQTVYRSAAAYATNNFAMSLNGGTALTDGAGSIPTGLNNMKIGRRSSANTEMFGWIRRLTYYPTRLPDATLQALTA